MRPDPGTQWKKGCATRNLYQTNPSSPSFVTIGYIGLIMTIEVTGRADNHASLLYLHKQCLSAQGASNRAKHKTGHTDMRKKVAFPILGLFLRVSVAC
jgi:hypothetical protein